MNWCKSLKGRVCFNEPLRKHTTFKIGGPADIWFEPESWEDLKRALFLSKQRGVPVFVIGEGSNLLVGDRGFRGVVIRLSAASFKRITYQGETVTLGAGLSLEDFLKKALTFGLGAVEFLSGLPGTVGGALVMNAGLGVMDKAQNPKFKNIGDLVQEVSIMDSQGRLRRLKEGQLRFGYRSSNLSDHIVLGAKLKLKSRNRGEIIREIKKFMEHRKRTQELSKSSAGCIFKNPVPSSVSNFLNYPSAGQLIDSCGLRGRRIGDAQISEKHANFIVNRGRARATEVLALIDLIKKRVKEKFGIGLELEIKVIGE